MNKILLFVAVCIVASVVNAQSIDLRKLNPNQVLELQIKALEMEKEHSTISTVAGISAVSRTEAQKWAELGQSVGMAMVAAAKEVGASVVEFSKTDIGKITTVIVVYKIIGKDILKIALGLLLIIGGPIAVFRLRNYVLPREVTYNYEDRKFFGMQYKKKYVTSMRSINSEDAFWVFFWACAISLVTVISGLLIALK